MCDTKHKLLVTITPYLRLKQKLHEIQHTNTKKTFKKSKRKLHLRYISFTFNQNFYHYSNFQTKCFPHFTPVCLQNCLPEITMIAARK